MATKTLGTNANNSIPNALAYLPGIGQMAAADVATLNNAIKDDLNPAHPRVPGSFVVNGQLYVPRRGWLEILPGDYVGVDSRGWPILLSADTIANGLWTHS